VIEKCVAGASVVDLCELGDQMILEETGKVYKKEKEMKKGSVHTYIIPFSLENTKLRLFVLLESYIISKSCNYSRREASQLFEGIS
jgi:hypothetical protein